MDVYKRIDELTFEGVSILQMNERPIIREWEQLLRRHIIKDGQVMQWDEEVLKSHLETMINCLKSQLFTEKKKTEENIDVKVILNEAKMAWRAKGIHIDKHELTFICHLLENATHKAIHTPDGSGITFRNHQAVHHFFTVLSQHLMPYPLDEINLSTYLNYLFSLPEFSVQFIVHASKEYSKFQVKDVVEGSGDSMDPGWLNMLQSIQTESIELLKKAVLRLMGGEGETSSGKYVFITQEIGNELLLFYVPQKNVSRTKAFLKLAFHMYEDIRETVSHAENQINWSSLVALFYEWVMRARRLEDAFEHIASGYVRYLPFERCALFLYLPKEKKGVGLTGYNLNVEEIKNITEQFSSPSMIQEFLKKIRTYRPIFIDHASDALPEYYANKFKLNSLVVSPIYSLSKKEFIGAVFLDQGEGQKFTVNDELMNVLVKMGHHVGEMLMQYQESQYDNLQKTITSRLSPREIEVMNLVKNGKSINEISIILHLSQYTVRDYISSSIKKVNGRNRTHAVAIAIQQGFI